MKAGIWTARPLAVTGEGLPRVELQVPVAVLMTPPARTILVGGGRSDTYVEVQLLVPHEEILDRWGVQPLVRALVKTHRVEFSEAGYRCSADCPEEAVRWLGDRAQSLQRGQSWKNSRHLVQAAC